MPKFRFAFRSVKCLSERRLRSRNWRLSTGLSSTSTYDSTGGEHYDILFEAITYLTSARAHALNCGFLDVPPLYKSSTSVEIAWTFLDTILRMIFSSLLKSAIYDVLLAHCFGQSVALT
jgi:hypothetical protein